MAITKNVRWLTTKGHPKSKISEGDTTAAGTRKELLGHGLIISTLCVFFVFKK